MPDAACARLPDCLRVCLQPAQCQKLKLVADAGAAIVFDYRCMHRGTANLSGLTRPHLCLVYTKAWFSDTLNYPPHSIAQVGGCVRGGTERLGIEPSAPCPLPVPGGGEEAQSGPQATPALPRSHRSRRGHCRARGRALGLAGELVVARMLGVSVPVPVRVRWLFGCPPALN